MIKPWHILTHSGCDYICDLYRKKPTKFQGRIDNRGTHEVLAVPEKLVAVDGCWGREGCSPCKVINSLLEAHAHRGNTM